MWLAWSNNVWQERSHTDGVLQYKYIPLHGSLLQKLVFLKYVLLPTFNAHNNVNVHDEIIIDSLVLVVASINNQNDVH